MRSIVKTLAIIAAAISLPGCVNEIEWHRKDEGKSLVMNAQLSSADSLHCIYLSIGDYSTVESISDGAVKCFVNGSLAAEGTALDGDDESYLKDDRFIQLASGSMPSMMRQSRFIVKASFKPGDLVRIEATAVGGKYSAWTEVRVPQAPSCTVSDTTMTSEGERSSFPVVAIRVKGNDISDGRDCFRLTAGVSGEAEAVHGDGTGSWIRVPLSFPEKSVRIDKGNDPILCDGVPGSDLDLFGAGQNNFLVFSDQLFDNGSFEFGFKVGAADVLLPGESIGEPCDTLCLESTLHVHVWGITQEEYHYLKALSIYEYNEGDISLTEPVSFPDNVEGGVGIVSIATPGECTVTFRRRYPRYGILYQPVSPDLP